MFRCAIRRSPSSSLANDCIMAMAEGLSCSFYSHFLGLLWKDGDSAYLAEPDSSVSSEWDSFCSIITQMCRSHVNSQKDLNSMRQSSWEFLTTSQFHKNFCKHNFINGVSVTSFDVQEIDSCGLNLDAAQKSKTSFYVELLMESMDCLHAVYESLKLDSLHKK